MHSSFRVFHSPNTPLADPFRFYKPLPQANQTSRHRSPGNTNGILEPKSKHLDNQPGRGTEKERGCHPRSQEGERTASESDCAFPGERRCDELHQTVPSTESDIECTVMHAIRPSAVEGNSPENAVVIDDESIESNDSLSKQDYQVYTNGPPEGAYPTVTGSPSGGSFDMNADTMSSDIINSYVTTLNADGDDSFIEQPTQDVCSSLSKATANQSQPVPHSLELDGRNEAPALHELRGHHEDSDCDSDFNRLYETIFTHKRKDSQTTEIGIHKRRHRTSNKVLSMHKMVLSRLEHPGSALDQSIDSDDNIGEEASLSLGVYENASAPSPQTQRAPSIGGDENDEYEVEDILDVRLCRGELEYLVDWLGYPKDTTWYKAGNLKNCPHKLRAFHKANPARPGPPKRLEYWIQCWDEDRDAEDHSWDNKPRKSRSMY